MEFAYDGGGLAKGGDVTLYYDGNPVGAGRVEMTQPMVFSADETTDIGYESGTTVAPDYTAHTSRFTGKIDWVQLDLGDRRQRPLHRPRGATAGRDGPPVSQAMEPGRQGHGRCSGTRGGWSTCPRSGTAGRPVGSAGSSWARTDVIRP